MGALVLALAGLRWPGRTQAVQLVAAFDLSASMYDRQVAGNALLDLAGAVTQADPELAVVAFARQPGSERPLAKLPPSQSVRTRARGAEAPPPDLLRPALPDLANPKTALDEGASDYGLALDFARGLFRAPEGGGPEPARAIVLVGDGLDTAGRAQAAAAALHGSGIELLAWPAAMGGGGDVRLDAVQLPERVQAGRGLNLEATVASLQPAEVVVRVGRWTGERWEPVASVPVKLAASGDRNALECRATVRIADHPPKQGVAQYMVAVEGPGGAALPGDFKRNNMLHAAVRVEGPRRWAVLARPNRTLARWFSDRVRVLGVDADLYLAGQLPVQAQVYRRYAGVLVDGLSARDLPPDSAALRALNEALRPAPEAGGNELLGGLGLVAVGGEAAFGAGEHPAGGLWEGLLPVTFRPEEDRKRTILFLLDISYSMNDDTPRGKKLAYACEQLGLLVRPGETNSALQPSDRVGLVAFSASARVAAPVSAEPSRRGFVEVLSTLKIESNTSLLAAFNKAGELLEKDDAEERLIVMLSDGVDTTQASGADFDAAIRKLCPEPEGGARRRTTFHAFGIGTDARDTNEKGAALLTRLARLGGGEFHPDFFKFAERLRQVFDEGRKDLYTRYENFGVSTRPHAVLHAAGLAWPVLPFRNRVRARPESEALALSRPVAGEGAAGSHKSDPVLTLGRLGASRTAALALALDGEAGAALLAPGENWKGGRALLGALLSWAEGGDAGSEGWRVESEPADDGNVRVTLYVEDPKTGLPRNGLKITARLSPLHDAAGILPAANDGINQQAELRPVAPGRYSGELPAGREGVYRLEITEAGGVTLERFVTVPYPAELRRFGTDRNALGDWVQVAGGHSRMVNLPPRDLAEWLKAQGTRRSHTPLRPALIVLAVVFMLCEIAVRGMRGRR